MFVVGNNGVELIVEHQPQVEGDKFYYDVQMVDGNISKTIRVFNADRVIFERVLSDDELQQRSVAY
jgi:hypothetical protein